MTDTAAPSTGGAPGPLVMLGDSLTEAGPWESAMPEHRVVNAGRTGDTTADVADRLQEVIDLAPAAVVLTVGTNDAKLRATVEQVVRGTEDVLFRLRHELPDVRLVVCSVPPRERERAEWLHEVNIHVRQFAPTVKAEFVDLWPALAADDGELKPEYTEDRLHLNEAGYAAWIGRLRDALA